MSRPRPSVSQRHRLGENAAWRSGIRGTLVGGRIAIFSGFRSCSRAVCLRHAAADLTAPLSGPVSGEIDLTCCEPFVWLGLFIYSVWLLFGWVLLSFVYGRQLLLFFRRSACSCRACLQFPSVPILCIEDDLAVGCRLERLLIGVVVKLSC